MDVAALDAAKDLRDKTDTDSGAVLHFVNGFHKELGLEIPDMNVGKFTTLNGSVKYLLSKAGKT